MTDCTCPHCMFNRAIKERVDADDCTPATFNEIVHEFMMPIAEFAVQTFAQLDGPETEEELLMIHVAAALARARQAKSADVVH